MFLLEGFEKVIQTVVVLNLVSGVIISHIQEKIFPLVPTRAEESVLEYKGSS